MKEPKVYVDELPKCIFCPMLVNLSNIGESKELMCCLNRTAYCNDYSDIEKVERNFKLACPLKSLKTHDRELVKEVCETIRKTIASTVDLAESNQQIKDQFHIILDQIQKEAENE